MSECVCDDCGMTFDIKMLQSEQSMLHGERITVLSFTCPKCNKKYIVSVLDGTTATLRSNWQKAQQRYQDLIESSTDYSADPAVRLARNETAFYRKRTLVHMNKLKKAYMRSLKRGKH